MIKIFKEHLSKTCILDDFGFYESRQKTIQEKKAKQQQFQKQVKTLPFLSIRNSFKVVNLFSIYCDKCLTVLNT